MAPGALEVYGRTLAARRPLDVAFPDGRRRPLPLARWLETRPGAAELALLRGVRGPALEVGCGPGRHIRALLDAGVLAVGLDVSADAVALAGRTGALALRGSVWDAVPGAGDWRDVLLLDGSLGIGGDPVALLRRVAGLLAPGGSVWLELDPPGTPSGPVEAVLEGPAGRSATFAWGRLAPDHVEAAAGDAGFRPAETWERDGRWFARLATA